MSATKPSILDVALALLAGAALGLGTWCASAGVRTDLADPSLFAPALERALPVLDAMMVVGALLGVALAFALRSVVSPRWTAAAMCAVGAAALVARVSSGPTAVASITAIALGAALLAGVAVHAHRRAPSVVPAAPPDGEGGRRVHFLAWAVPALVAVVVYSTWSITRHEGFGSGAWDLGIFVHSTWLVAHGAGFTSSVLGDVNFLGDHFSPIWLLAAPLSYLGGAEVLLLAQAILIAAAAWPLALLARRAQLGPLSVSAITIAYLFSMGTLSCAAFDVHEIAPVPLFMLFAVYGFQVERRVIAYPALLLLCSCKESAILYAAAIGAWLLFTVRGRRLEGLAVGAACTACFFLVVGVVQPALLAGGPQGMIHLQRFSEFGDTLSSAAGNMLLHPGKTLLVLVSPAEKIATLQQTLGTFGLLPLLSPGTLLLASANLMERFLSNKREMWGIGFHYSLPLTGVCAFASVLAAARVRRLVEATFVRFLPGGAAREVDAALAALVLVSGIGVAAFIGPDYELKTLSKPYFSTPAQIEVNRRALALIPKDAAVVAQNHLLPHLAGRAKIWRPEWQFVERADFVIVNPVENAWPKDAPFIIDMTWRLLADRRFTLVFSEGSTLLFQRGTAERQPLSSAALAALRR